ncbi:oxidation resistance protein 1 isoform X2 [Ambystoma mexicanum]|uniref:oxidation resistance protein 1 isoform X2 n=1 Tax=Ambystoma mexicanum TaxID=8296 RepID=UPI0037E98AD9
MYSSVYFLVTPLHTCTPAQRRSCRSRSSATSPQTDLQGDVGEKNRLKKKSQSVDITAPGYNPLAEPQVPQASKVAPVLKATASEEEQNNTTNAQRRNPRRWELKRYYTIDTGQKRSLEKKDGRRMSFQRPKGSIEYTVESRDTLNSIALKFDTTPNELVQLNKLFSRAVVAGQILYVPDPDYISSVESSPSLSPISPLSPTSSEAEFDKSIDPDGFHRKEATSSPALTCVRPARVVSSTSEEEEAFTEKFLKINCKYITDGKGTVSGVLLVTPNNIMFDPHKTDPLVQEKGCEEYGIMCPMEEVTSAAMYKDIVDCKVKDLLPIDIEQLSQMRDFCSSKKITRSNTDEMDFRIRDTGNDSASTAPRSTEESLSEDVFTESELSPIREELVSSDELRQDKSSGASSESVQTINQMNTDCLTNLSDSADAPSDFKSCLQLSANDSGFVSHANDLERPETAIHDVESSVIHQIRASSKGSLEDIHRQEKGLILETPTVQGCTNIENASQDKCEVKDQNALYNEATLESLTKETAAKGKLLKQQTQDSETEMEELRQLWKTHTMQQAMQQRETMQQASQKEIKHRTPKTDGHTEGCSLMPKEKRRHKSHKFLCLKVGKPMRKTFVSHASATMQQYAQRDKKHEYWFAVPHERTDHLYAFFIQWTPELYAEETGEFTREPGFVVVKRNIEREMGDYATSEAAAIVWEITREDVNSKQTTSVKVNLEPEVLKPNLSEPSTLLTSDEIEKLTKHLPPRTIGYPWTLAYSTGKNGMSLKTLYRTMLGLDTPVLLVIKDSDGQVFGALSSEPFKVSEGFYGTGETFLFTFFPSFHIFKWTGDNMFFIKGDMDALAFGGGGGEFALWLDGDLYHGRSHSCKTFANPTLSKKEDFIVQDIEIWAFQ